MKIHNIFIVKKHITYYIQANFMRVHSKFGGKMLICSKVFWGLYTKHHKTKMFAS
jgi:hypothetical protein